MLIGNKHQSVSAVVTTQTTMLKLVVLSSVLAMAASSAIGIGPLGLGLGWAGLAGPWGAQLAAPLAAPIGLAHGAIGVAQGPVLGAYNYRGPLSLAPGQPANIVAADGRPLDTLSVNLDRAAHYTARAVDGSGLHLLKKRSAPLLAPAAWSHSARIDIPAARLVAPAHLGVAAPLAWRGPLGLGPVGPIARLGGPIAPWGHAAALGQIW